MEKQLSRLEELAFGVNPDYKHLLKMSQELQRQINEINQLNLENPDERLKYDQETPPCALLKLESYEQEVFTEAGRRMALFLLRLELSDFLEGQGEECYHPSDLTRKDFHSDFVYNPLLDE